MRGSRRVRNATAIAIAFGMFAVACSGRSVDEKASPSGPRT